MSCSRSPQECLFSHLQCMKLGLCVYFNTLSTKMSCAVNHCYIPVLCIPLSPYIYVSVDMSFHIHVMKGHDQEMLRISVHVF